VKVTQGLAILSSLVFPEASLLDISIAIQMFPQLCKNNQNEKKWGVAFSCILRSIQGLLAVIAVFLLVMTSSDVTEIVLNFTAVNFISLLDDAAFKLARDGKYGLVMEEAAERVVEEPVPRCMISKTSHGHRIALFVISAFLFGMMCFVFVFQGRHEKWLTQVIQVRFGRSDALESYSGCYEIKTAKNLNNRYEYKLFDLVPEDTQTYIGYCKKDRRWVVYSKQNNSKDPCGARESNEDELAHSAKTDAFDIGTSFEEAWYSASNEPIEVTLFELGNQPRCFSGWNDVGEGILSNKIGKELKKFTQLDISDLDFVGTLPSEIGELTGLTDFKVGGNGFTGSVPSEIGELTGLKRLNFGRNGFTGSVPSEIGLLTGLTYLGLSDNAFAGSVPSEIGSLTKITYLDLADSGFTGSVPSEIGSLTKITYLNLGNNGFTGSVPSEIGLLTGLTYLHLADSGFTGSVPSEIGELTGLKRLNFGRNGFTGSVPSEIGLLTGLTYLGLSDNAFAGSVPSEIGSLTKITYLNLADNAFTGSFPGEIGALTGLRDFYFDVNDFTGSVPSQRL